MATTSPAELIRAARRAARMTQTEVADKLGTSQAAVARLERSDANPTIATLERVLGATGHRLELGARRSRPSVDETLIARHVRLTPAERLRAFRAAHSSLAPLAGAARKARGRRR